MPPAVFRKLAAATKHGAAGTLFHHGAEKLCKWAVDLSKRRAIRDELASNNMRLVWFTNGFWPKNHNYSRLASVLPRVLHEELDYGQQKCYVEDIADEKQQDMTRSAIFAIGGLAIRVPPTIKQMLVEHINQKTGKSECHAFLTLLSKSNPPRQGESEVELRELARQAFLQDIETLMPATRVAPPSFMAVLKHTAIMLSQFPIERCVDFLAFRADAAVTNIGAGGDGAKRRVDFSHKHTDWMEAKMSLQPPTNTYVQCYVVQGVSRAL